MGKLDYHWERIDEDCYKLKDAYCFPGTKVYVDQTGHKNYPRWRVRMVNIVRAIGIDSAKEWATSSVARNKALAIRYNHSWLEKIGIDVYDPRYSGLELMP